MDAGRHPSAAAAKTAPGDTPRGASCRARRRARAASAPGGRAACGLCGTDDSWPRPQRPCRSQPPAHAPVAPCRGRWRSGSSTHAAGRARSGRSGRHSQASGPPQACTDSTGLWCPLNSAGSPGRRAAGGSPPGPGWECQAAPRAPLRSSGRQGPPGAGAARPRRALVVAERKSRVGADGRARPAAALERSPGCSRGGRPRAERVRRGAGWSSCTSRPVDSPGGGC